MLTALPPDLVAHLRPRNNGERSKDLACVPHHRPATCPEHCSRPKAPPCPRLSTHPPGPVQPKDANCPKKVHLAGGLALPVAPVPPVGGSDFPQNEPERALTYKGVLRFSGSILQMEKLKSGDGRKSLGAIQRVTAKPRPAPGLPVASQGVYTAS